MNMKRYALVSLAGSNREQLERYLPGNYKIIGDAPQNREAPGTDPTYFGDCLVIAGRDDSGWTLDGYVIPRFQSGLHGCREIDLSHECMKAIEEDSMEAAEDWISNYRLSEPWEN